MADLESSVSLDISSALSDADQLAESAGEALEAALSAAVESFQSSYSSALGDLGGQLADSLTDIPVTADTAAAESSVAELAAGASEPQSMPVDADTESAQSGVTSLVEAIDDETASIQVDADTADAEANVNDLAVGVEDAATSASQATGSVGGLADKTVLLSGAASLAKGEVGGLQDVAAGAGEGMATAAGSAFALGAGVGFLFQKGVEATGSLQRFNTIVGDMKDRLLTVNVGTLNEDLDSLAIKLGTDDEALRDASASLFQFAINSGASRSEAADFTEKVDALAARAVALNPSLGSVADVAESMATRLQRGGRFVAQYGLDLNSADIQTKALGDSHKSSAEDLSIFEKSSAAADIAVGKYGGTLGETVAKGAQNAAIQQRSLKEQLDNVIESAGKPLVTPIFDVIRASLPAVGELGEDLSIVAQGALPALEGALQIVTPLLQTTGDVLHFVVDALQSVPGGTTAMGAGIGFLISGGNPIGALVGGLGGLVSELGLFGDAQETGTKQVHAFADALEQANGQIDKTTAGAARSLLDERNQIDDLARAHVTLDQVLAGTNTTTGRQRDLLRQLAQATQVAREYDEDYDGTLKDTTISLDEAHDRQDKLIQKLRETNPALAEVAAGVLRDKASNVGFIQTLLDLADAHGNVTKKSKERADAGATNADIADGEASAFETARDAADQYGQGLISASDYTKALQAAGEELRTELDLLFGNFISQQQAQLTYEDELEKLGQKLLATGFSFRELTSEGRANREEFLNLGRDAESWSLSILNAGGSVSDAVAPLQNYRDHLQQVRDGLAAAGQDTSFIDGLIHNTDAAIAGVKAKAPEMQQAGSDVSGAGAQGARDRGEDWRSAGSFVAGILWGGVSSGGPAVAGAGASISQAGATAAGSVDWSGAGALGAVGFAGGISSGTGQAEDAGRALGEAAKRAAQSVLQIFSPSRVFRDEVGLPVAQGFALGITAGTPHVEAAVGGLGKAAIRSANFRAFRAPPVFAARPVGATVGAATTAGGRSGSGLFDGATVHIGTGEVIPKLSYYAQTRDAGN